MQRVDWSLADEKGLVRRGIGTSPNARWALELERLLEILLDDLLVILEEEM